MFIAYTLFSHNLRDIHHNVIIQTIPSFITNVIIWIMLRDFSLLIGNLTVPSQLGNSVEIWVVYQESLVDFPKMTYISHKLTDGVQ